MLIQQGLVPPTMMVNVAFSAPPVPPETGASRNLTPFFWDSAATCFEVWGAMELMSMSTVPGLAPSRTPPGT